MSEVSRPRGLAERLQEQQTAQQAAIDHHVKQVGKMMRNSLDSLGETWSKSVADAHELTEQNIRAEARRLGKLWLRTTVIGLAVFVAIWVGVSVVLQWYRVQTETSVAVLVRIEQRIEGARQLLAELEPQTGGVQLREIEGERYLVLPLGSEPAGTISGLEAVKLPR